MKLLTREMPFSNKDMGKKRPLSEEEIWDDSVLIESWDEALAEYKVSIRMPLETLGQHADMLQHYHSLHARGERVEDVLRMEDEAELAS